MKLLRTLRLDESDTIVFENAAESGEWAVPGSFMFMNADPDRLEGKARVAFRSGFLGIDTFGWSTLVQVVSATEADRAQAVELLAYQLMSKLGAPDIASAAAAAEDELEFAASLCDQDESTIIALQRSSEGGNIRETFRTLRPSEGAQPARAFTFFEVEGEEDEPAEQVNLIELAKGKRK